MGAECASDPVPESETMTGRDIEEEVGAERGRTKGLVAEAQRGENEAEAGKGGKEGPEAEKDEKGDPGAGTDETDGRAVEIGEGVRGVEARKGGIERESAPEAGVGVEAKRESQG